MLRALPLVLILALAAGCTSSRYDRYGRSYPASARTTSSSGQARYVVCHKDKKTMTLPGSAVEAHRRHGDRFGACSRQDRRDARTQRGQSRNEARRNQGRKQTKKGKRN